MTNWQKSYDSFLARIQESGELWSLNSEDGWVICDSAEFEDAEVMPFWSNKAEADRHCVDQWSDYRAERISLIDFVELWLPNLAEDDILVGPDWNEDLEGLEVEPGDIAESLLEV
ncbi:DUF2750 domain-containing protein [Gallaecimonas kandeliae]|uniref:DUF2750 domain-containing protein n=1 Tax=Gallaecimonas kandeliae TaxID=3029055 RepID=UPI002648D367|nr:DUF2750 domain-containing protein [Gallaecimonas kandeliae]WKE65020.1 DUF2750 domain-containing protein [Gallaecimonas kandeliae]